MNEKAIPGRSTPTAESIDICLERINPSDEPRGCLICGRDAIMRLWHINGQASTLCSPHALALVKELIDTVDGGIN